MMRHRLNCHDIVMWPAKTSPFRRYLTLQIALQGYFFAMFDLGNFDGHVTYGPVPVKWDDLHWPMFLSILIVLRQVWQRGVQEFRYTFMNETKTVSQGLAFLLACLINPKKWWMELCLGFGLMNFLIRQ